MKYLHVTPKKPIYIEGRQVVDYRVLANAEEIKQAYTRTHTKRGQKAVYQYDQGKSLVGIYSSISEAARSTGGSRTHIGQVIDHDFHTSGGFTWRSKMI